jgi:hypothetical protein
LHAEQGGVRRSRLAGGERLGGFIYGTIVALSVVVAGSKAYPHEPGHAAVVVAITSVVFWLAHVYAHGLGQSVARDERLRLAPLRHVAYQELALVEAAVPPVVALLLGALGLLSAGASYWVAFALGLLVLGAEGILYARIERLGAPATLVVVAANEALGLVLIALKLFISH